MTDSSSMSMKREHFIFLTVAGMLALNIPSSLLALGWHSAAFNTGLFLVLFAAWIVRRRDLVVLSWIVFGIAAGFTELVADWWLVHDTRSLVYPAAEPHLAASPAYMPFAWTLIMAQMLGIACWFKERLPGLGAAVATALVCGVNIPLYEHLAKDAGWWFYQDTPMLFNAPYYIILGEALIGLPLVAFAGFLARSTPEKLLLRAFGLGVIAGLTILAAYFIAWWLVGPCDGAVLQLTCRG